MRGHPAAALLATALLTALPLGPLAVSRARGADHGANSWDLALSQPRTFWPETGFGGYRMSVLVSEISAQWSVPRIAPLSQPGSASTWIGAQSPSGPPFVQLGSIEYKLAGRAPVYELFWSDASVGYLPQPVAAASPGEQIAVSMRHSATGWVLRASDLADHTVSTKRLAYGADESFTQAEWVQEDPAPSTITPRDLPYPRLSPVTFADLEVNGRPPSLSRADGRSLMTSNEGDYVPTAVAGDAFSLVRPRGRGLRYLVYAGSLDSVLSKLDALFARWATVPGRLKAAAAHDAVEAYYRFDARLASQAWPGTANRAVVRLIHQNALVARATRRWIADGMAIGGPAYSRMVRAERSPDAALLRADLGLPPV